MKRRLLTNTTVFVIGAATGVFACIAWLVAGEEAFEHPVPDYHSNRGGR